MMSMVLMKRKLNDRDMDLLKKIFEFGGYTTSISINNYRNDRDISNNRRFLYKLVEEGYIKEKKFYSDSRRDAVVYQVTAKTCKLFDNPGSYFRKKHSEPYIIRALIKQHFFFEICKSFDPYIISSHERRVELLTKDLGYDIGLLPKKCDTDTYTTHVEEYIIDARNIGTGNLPCLKIGETLFDFEDKANGIIIVYTDRSEVNCYTQLMGLYERYKALINSEKARIDFLIVVDSESREISYKKAIKKHFAEARNKVYPIHDNIIKLHMKILTEDLNVPPEKLQVFPSKIKKKYSQYQKPEEKDFDSLPIKEIRMNGLKAIEKLADGILGLNMDREEKVRQINEFFGKIYKLYAAGKLKKGTDFDIKVYRISYKFSL